MNEGLMQEIVKLKEINMKQELVNYQTSKFLFDYKQLGSMKTTPLLNKYNWNEDLLNRQNLTWNCS